MVVQPYPNYQRGRRQWLRSGRWRQLAVVLACIELVVAGTVFGHLGGGAGARFASAASGGADPVSRLGSTLDQSGCQSVRLAIGKGFFVVCDDYTANTAVDGTVRVVSLYAAGNPVVEEYKGPLPRSLKWGDSIKDVAAALGDPCRVTDIYGPPTLVYKYEGEPYGSLELQFDTNQRLYRVNACITH
jgi:hypothetical protein